MVGESKRSGRLDFEISFVGLVSLYRSLGRGTRARTVDTFLFRLVHLISFCFILSIVLTVASWALWDWEKGEAAKERAVTFKEGGYDRYHTVGNNNNSNGGASSGYWASPRLLAKGRVWSSRGRCRIIVEAVIFRHPKALPPQRPLREVCEPWGPATPVLCR
jgi:hypothetical protein